MARVGLLVTTHYTYAVAVWIADPDNLQESKGDLLGEFDGRNLAIALRKAHEAVVFDARGLDDDSMVLEVRRVPITDAVENE